ncbi:hypothetical protein ER17_13520 [Mycobacterium tuberculosis]|nr:hypothetical protein ER17_13520 [Mycobacterium tuberculosis]
MSTQNTITARDASGQAAPRTDRCRHPRRFARRAECAPTSAPRLAKRHRPCPSARWYRAPLARGPAVCHRCRSLYAETWSKHIGIRY